MSEQNQLPNLQVSNKKITEGLLAFEARKAKLEELKASALSLKIDGVEDKKGLEAVSNKRKELKKERTAIQNEGLAMRSDLTVMGKNISLKEKELIAIIEPEEDALQAKEDAIKAEIARIEQEKIDTENMRVQNRINQLFAFGFAADYNEVKTASDETFGQLLLEAETAHKEEIAAKAEVQRIADEAAAKLKADLEELETLRKEAAEKQRLIDIENEHIAAEQKKKDDEILAEQTRLKAEKEKIESDRKQAEFEASEKIRLAQLKEEREAEIKAAQEKAAESARLKAIADAKREQEEIAAKILADKKESERLAALLPEKQKLQLLAIEISKIILPDLKDAKAIEIGENVKTLLQKVQDYINKNIKSL